MTYANANTTSKPLVIVGGGLAGTVTLVRMLEKIAHDDTLKAPVKIVMIEKDEKQEEAGVAYGLHPQFKHILNIASERISPFIDAASHRDLPTFVEYVHDLHRAEDKNLINPRRQVFGEYLKYITRLAIQKAGDKAHVEFQNKSVIDVQEQKNGQAAVVTDDGATIDASHVILATGHKSAIAPAFAKAVANGSLFLDTPYSQEANAFFDKVVAKKTGKVMIVGTGLTADDIAVRLMKSGYEGKIVMRSGHLAEHPVYGRVSPEEYLEEKRLPGEPVKTLPRPRFLEQTDFHAMLDAGIKEYKEMSSKGYSDEEIMNSWEKYLPEVVERFPENQQEMASLFKQYKGLINTRRVGVTPFVGEAIQDGIKRGQIVFESGKVSAMRQTADGMTVAFEQEHNGHTKTKAKEYDYVFSATGENNSYAVGHDADPLWNSLMEKGMAEPHWTGVGVDVDHDFSLRGKDGRISKSVSVLGVPVAGHLMVSDYPYPEKAGHGGRTGPFVLNIPGISGEINYFVTNEYNKLTDGYRQKAAAPAPHAKAAPKARAPKLAMG